MRPRTPSACGHTSDTTAGSTSGTDSVAVESITPAVASYTTSPRVGRSARGMNDERPSLLRLRNWIASIPASCDSTITFPSRSPSTASTAVSSSGGGRMMSATSPSTPRAPPPCWCSRMIARTPL